MNLENLKNAFPAYSISWRIGATNSDKTEGLALAYIDARDVQNRLDAVCGPEGWQCRHEPVGSKVTCHIGVKCGDEWVWKSNGAGDTDVEGDKGAYSDSFKRAAVMWGIGEYLYHIKSPWVKIEQRGRSSVIKPDELSGLAEIVGGEFYAPLGVTKLIEAARAMAGDIQECDEEQLSTLLESKQSKAIINQLKTDRVGWWHGHGKDENAPGLKFRIEARREELKGQAE